MGGVSATRRYCLMSLHPWAAEAILSGRKTAELRRIVPALSEGDVIVVYATSPVQRVCGTVGVQRVSSGLASEVARAHGEAAMTGVDGALEYLDGGRRPGAVLLRDPRPAEPITLGYRPPQSYCALDPGVAADQRLLRPAASEEGLRLLAPYAIPDEETTPMAPSTDTPADELGPPYVINVDDGFDPNSEPRTWNPEALVDAPPADRADLARHMVYAFYRNMHEQSAQMEAIAVMCGVPAEELDLLAAKASLDDQQKTIQGD